MRLFRLPLTRVPLSGEKTSALIVGRRSLFCVRSEMSGVPISQRQSSCLAALASVLPSGENTNAVIGWPCSVSLESAVPVFVSQRQIFPSHPLVASVLPSGEKASWFTSPLCAFRVKRGGIFSAPEKSCFSADRGRFVTSRERTRPSLLPLATVWPSGENANWTSHSFSLYPVRTAAARFLEMSHKCHLFFRLAAKVVASGEIASARILVNSCIESRLPELTSQICNSVG